MRKPYCTECPYFTDIIYDEDEWYGARCKKDGHSELPSMYAIKWLNKNCPLTSENEGKE